MPSMTIASGFCNSDAIKKAKSGCLSMEHIYSSCQAGGLWFYAWHKNMPISNPWQWSGKSRGWTKRMVVNSLPVKMARMMQTAVGSWSSSMVSTRSVVHRWRWGGGLTSDTSARAVPALLQRLHLGAKGVKPAKQKTIGVNEAGYTQGFLCFCCQWIALRNWAYSLQHFGNNMSWFFFTLLRPGWLTKQSHEIHLFLQSAILASPKKSYLEWNINKRLYIAMSDDCPVQDINLRRETTRKCI